MSARGPPLVYLKSTPRVHFTHWSVKKTWPSFVLPPVSHPLFISNTHEETLGHFSGVKICFLCLLWVSLRFAWGQLWVLHSRTTQTLKRHIKQTRGLVRVCFLLGWVWLVLYKTICLVHEIICCVHKIIRCVKTIYRYVKCTRYYVTHTR